MNKYTGNMWDLVGHCDALCITTNGGTKRSGEAIMGRGNAKEALNRYPGIDRTLGEYLNRWGNRPMKLVQDQGTWIVSFPTKPKGLYLGPSWAGKEWPIISYMESKFVLGDKVPGWALKSDLNLIKSSAELLKAMADKFSWGRIYIPFPGVGNGELNPVTVEGELDSIFEIPGPDSDKHYTDSRFILVSKGKNYV